MAALRGTIRSDRSRVTRLFHRTINVHADTWQTFTEVQVNADGSGWVSVRQPAGEVLYATWAAETGKPAVENIRTLGVDRLANAKEA